MSERGWLEARRPRPPAELARALADAWDAASGADPFERLRAAALDDLRGVLGAGAGDREAAYTLLRADALLTYAAEAALEAADVPAALERLAADTGGLLS